MSNKGGIEVGIRVNLGKIGTRVRAEGEAALNGTQDEGLVATLYIQII